MDPVTIFGMPVIARDAVASDHLVFAWPFPIGPEEHEVSCADDELVVMCPSFMVGDRLGPGRHRWRTQDPMRPVSAYFVLAAPVEVSFDMLTQFLTPTTGQGVRIRATGSLQVRCMDPGLLVAQFVGLPFDHVNDGVLRSVSRSVERMLARLLTRRVIMAGTPNAVTDPQMLQSIIEELVAYNPVAGAVFGVELVRMGHMTILADDGARPWQQMGAMGPSASGSNPRLPANGHWNLLETMRQNPPPPAHPAPSSHVSHVSHVMQGDAAGHVPMTASGPQHARAQSQPIEASGEIVVRPIHGRSEKTTAPGHAAVSAPTAEPRPTPDPHRVITTPLPARAIDITPSTEEETQPGRDLTRGAALHGGDARTDSDLRPTPPQPRGAILGIGMSPIGSEPDRVAPQAPVLDGPPKIAPGGRVLVPGPNGLMQSATVRQLLQGYYELEVGGSGETIWVPINGVVPE